MLIDVTTYYLEMTHPDDLRPKPPVDGDLALLQAQVPCPELNRFLYTAVGGDWYWIDRLAWTYEQWLAWLQRPAVETWVAYVSGTPAGYFELEAQAEGNVELTYFGLLPQCIGQGWGGPLLTAAIERAWRLSASRVWVHTCSLGHPSAMANYTARGFRLFRQECQAEDLPERAPAGRIRMEPAGPLSAFSPSAGRISLSRALGSEAAGSTSTRRFSPMTAELKIRSRPRSWSSRRTSASRRPRYPASSAACAAFGPPAAASPRASTMRTDSAVRRGRRAADERRWNVI